MFNKYRSLNSVKNMRCFTEELKKVSKTQKNKKKSVKNTEEPNRLKSNCENLC